VKELDEGRDAAVADVVKSVRAVLREAILNGENCQPVLERLETLNAASSRNRTIAGRLQQKVVRLREEVAKLRWEFRFASGDSFG
jgi:hypothetical protein